MITNDRKKFYIDLEARYGIPRQVIEVICNSPFKFTSDAISNLDPKPVMMAYLGKFKIKKKFKKDADTQI